MLLSVLLVGFTDLRYFDLVPSVTLARHEKVLHSHIVPLTLDRTVVFRLFVPPKNGNDLFLLIINNFLGILPNIFFKTISVKCISFQYHLFRVFVFHEYPFYIKSSIAEHSKLNFSFYDFKTFSKKCKELDF